MRVLYSLIALLVIGGYAYADFNGREFRTTKRQKIAAGGVRGSQGGATALWYRGYRGGK